MAAKPLVSVIIPCYVPGRSIERILKSIKNQTFKRAEILCVDAITRPDKTIKPIVRKYGTYLVYGPERSNQRNFGAKHARGKYLLFLDQDTILSGSVIQECVDTIKKNSMIMIPENSFGEGFWSNVKSFERSMYRGGDVSQGARFFEKRGFWSVGGYDPDLVGTEDLDLFNKLKNKGVKPLEIKSCILHDEGRLSLKKVSRRIIYYSSSFLKYKRKYPEISRKQFTLLRPTYFRNWKKMIMSPGLAYGFIVLKMVEGFSALYGMYLKNTWGDYKKETGE